MTAASIEIECAIDARDLLAVIQLDTSSAPAACELLTAYLPLTTDAYHTKWNGHEIYLVLPPFPDLPPENVTSTPQPGDVMLFRREATYRAAPQHLRAAGLGAYTELGLYYGSLTRSFGPSGEVAGTRLGRIVAGLEPLREAAQAMRREGFAPMRLQRRP